MCLPKLQSINRYLNMKGLLVFIFISISACAFSQSRWYKTNTKEFSSSFNNLKEGYFSGFAEGLLLLGDERDSLFTISVCNESASLTIIPDSNEVYDVSFKNYNFENEKIRFEYVTYFEANALLIRIGGISYKLVDLIYDGAPMSVIKGLDYELLHDEESETLILRFTEKVALSKTNWFSNPDLSIIEGSILIFRIMKSRG